MERKISLIQNISLKCQQNEHAAIMAQWVNPDPPAARMELCRSRKSVLGNI